MLPAAAVNTTPAELSADGLKRTNSPPLPMNATLEEAMAGAPFSTGLPSVPVINADGETEYILRATSPAPLTIDVPATRD